MATRAHFIDHPNSSYEGDYAAWVGTQIELLRSGRTAEIDAVNIAEELGDLGESFYRAMTSAIAIVLAHMAKWEAQPDRRSRSWANSIAIHRLHAGDELERSPSLHRRLPEAVLKAWREARRVASSETDLPLKAFPVDCPYSWDEIMTRPFDWEGDE
jgi:hypothetical protein